MKDHIIRHLSLQDRVLYWRETGPVGHIEFAFTDQLGLATLYTSEDAHRLAARNGDVAVPLSKP